MREQPTVHFGAGIDTYLKAQGSLAQAVNRNTILISSRVLGMNPRDQMLLLLHEIAHLRQLSQRGRDPNTALEAEAWEAAHAWMAGKPYRIRGRGQGPLNAIAIIQGGPKGHPHAPLWYRASPVEPIGNRSSISISDVALIEKISVAAILDVIIAAKGTTEVLVVSHGGGSGLAIPIMDGSSAGAQREIITAVSADHPGEEVGFGGTKIKTPVISDKDVADLARLKEPEVKALRTKMNQVRAMKLTHVAFRACNMGIKTETLDAFRGFFGARSVSAPKEFDTYGDFSPSIGGDLEGWAKALRKSGYHISVDGHVGFGTRNTDNPLTYRIVSRADSKDAFRAWVREHIVDRGWGPRGVIFHGMKALHTLGPNAPSVYFVRDAEFISRIVYFAG